VWLAIAGTFRRVADKPANDSMEVSLRQMNQVLFAARAPRRAVIFEAGVQEWASGICEGGGRGEEGVRVTKGEWVRGWIGDCVATKYAQSGERQV
jgi:hypothetical protein